MKGPIAHRRAGVVSVGDELTLGQTLDTNSKWISERLVARGIVPAEHVTVADEAGALTRTLRRLVEDGADLIVMSGGLGPTADDLTREALAGAMGVALIEDAGALADLERWFAGRGRPMAALDRVQALRPEGARCLRNDVGTAPGLHGVLRAGATGVADVFCLPGPPGELRPMFHNHVEPALRPPEGRTVRVRAVHVFGLGESDLATRLGGMMDRRRNPLVGTTASGAVVTCRIRYEGPASVEEAERLLDEDERRVRAVAAEYVIGTGEQTLAGVVLELLKGRGAKVGVVESCTGGLLGALVTDVPGSSEAFVGGFVTYSNELKERLVGVPGEVLQRFGAVSRETAEAMATGGLMRLGADYCLSITGVAGPDGGSESKPVGTVWIGLACGGGGGGGRGGGGGGFAGTDVRRFLFNGDRATVRDRAARCALGMLRLHLIGAAGQRLLWQVE
jgi:nicotinamide-nucleotide amidase